MWKRKYLSKWSAIRTNEDALFELETALNNPSVRIIPQVLCVIDKTSGSNSEDLIKKAKIEENRNKVLQFAVNNIHNYTGQHKSIIKSVLWKRLYSLTSKQLKYKNYRQTVINIFILMSRINWLLC
jgi:hypothetical protein